MTGGKVVVRNKATGQEHFAWPVDAREQVASGEYETPTWPDPRQPAFPLTPKHAEPAPVEPAPVVVPTVEVVAPDISTDTPVTNEAPPEVRRGRRRG